MYITYTLHVNEALIHAVTTKIYICTLHVNKALLTRVRRRRVIVLSLSVCVCVTGKSL